MSELTQSTVGIVEYSPVESRLSELREKYAVVPDAETKEGYEACRLALRELVTCRTDIEKARKELKADVLERGRLIDGEAKRITAALLEIETPVKEAKAVVDDRIQREKEEAERRERERVEAIQRVIEGFERAPLTAIGKAPEHIQELIGKAVAYTVDPFKFGEYSERAELARKSAIEQLTTLKAQAEAKAAMEKELADERARMAAERAEFERQKAEAERKRAELEAEKAAAQASVSKPTPDVIQPTEQAMDELKAGIVTTAGPKVDAESPEEQAATAIAFTCNLTNEEARAVVAMIKGGNIPFVFFDKEVYETSKRIEGLLINGTSNIEPKGLMADMKTQEG